MQKKFRLIISILIFSIVVFIVFNAYDLSRKGSENQYNSLINNLNKDTTDFTTWVRNKKEILDTAKDVVDNFAYDEITGWNTLNPYLNINNDDPHISQIYIGLANGEFVTGGLWIPPDDYDPRTRVWYKEAVEAGETIISDVYIDRETGDRTVTISSPLIMEDRLVGVISTDVFMNDINDWLSNQIQAENVYSYILNAEGTVIVHTKRAELVGTNLYNDQQLYDSFFARKDLFVGDFEELKRSGGLIRMEYVAAGKKTRGIMRKVEEGDWYLAVAAVENNDLLSFINPNRNSIIFNMLMLVIILFLLKLVINIKLELDEKNQILTIDNERDFLTGVFNRRYFNLYMERLWKNADGCHEISLLMMDIDYFKGYNDTYGHIKGDEVLVKVTSVINETIRKQDVFARYGGEEFVLVLKQVPIVNAAKIAEKIVKAVFEANVENKSSPLERLTLSIGVASMNTCEKIDVRQFTNRADKALYEAKEGGRNRVVLLTGKES